ncbi:TetR/AcrR family transcriptional regulator [Actinacidiphila guanduensis]|jgi:polyketide synthase 12|uniref:Transcriptional regulator, TetR family n=1 Tax=Actinacidiphila guanduensis TaxID=310781 RepID=A0A1H0PWZ0_9ACTN|nr:TetR/AcrR family transcriptional regulator [Actinacidiphila guanduensis]SDP09691.1 transcriptional regulator, TetR family [Actinacidiphila guanduensis]
MDRPVVQVSKAGGERADAARNRAHLLDTARALMAEHGATKVTMDGLAASSGLGKGTVFRRFGSRAGIFRALLEDEETKLQQAVLSGPPPLGPGAAPLERLIAYGAARVDFLFDNYEIARAALDGGQSAPMGAQTPLSRIHIRMLLDLIKPPVSDRGVLATQLTAALDGPALLLLHVDDFADAKNDQVRAKFVQGWSDLVGLVCRHTSTGHG